MTEFEQKEGQPISAMLALTNGDTKWIQVHIKQPGKDKTVFGGLLDENNLIVTDITNSEYLDLFKACSDAEWLTARLWFSGMPPITELDTIDNPELTTAVPIFYKTTLNDTGVLRIGKIYIEYDGDRTLDYISVTQNPYTPTTETIHYLVIDLPVESKGNYSCNYTIDGVTETYVLNIPRNRVLEGYNDGNLTSYLYQTTVSKKPDSVTCTYRPVTYCGDVDKTTEIYHVYKV